MEQKDIIIKNEYPIWIKLLHHDYLERTSKIAGKWVYHDSPNRLAIIAVSLAQLIVEDLTRQIKYRPTLNNPNGPFRSFLPPLCVYSEPENKDQLYERIIQYDLQNVYWQSNEDTRELHKRIRQSK
ncbi:MAG: hypothetical protein AABY05_01430 [Nanoarchaeota archaeon]